MIRNFQIVCFGCAILVVIFAGATAIAAEPTAEANDGLFAIKRLPDNPILRPDMMPKDDGQWSGNLNFPSLIRVPDWIEKPLGKYYLYFSAHHGSYIRLAYADRIEGPWKIYEPGSLRLQTVLDVNHAQPVEQSHIASPDVHVDDKQKQIRMYFHYLLPKLGHSSSVAFSSDGITFVPRAGAIAGPYLRVFRREGAYFAIDDRGAILRSPDGIAHFDRISDAVSRVANDRQKQISFRHGGALLEGNHLSVFFSRIGDAPEQILVTRVDLSGDPSSWKASVPSPVLAPEMEWEGTKFELVRSTFTGQTNVRQLRDPYIYEESGKRFLLYSVAGETGIALARIESGNARR
jgi:hypothetical protein